MAKSEIARLNDFFRSHGYFSGIPGKTVLTPGIYNLPDKEIVQIMIQVKRFDDFTPDNDPHKEHDFGSFVHDGEKIYWKIDYYDSNFEYGSEDPSDPAKTGRVLTILLASEY